MKFTKYFLLALTTLLLLSCGDDQELATTTNCTQEDWLGSYSGTEECTHNNGDVSMVISALGPGIHISLESTATEIDLIFILDDCEITLEEEDLSLSGTLEGDVVVLNLTIVDETECLYILNRI